MPGAILLLCLLAAAAPAPAPAADISHAAWDAMLQRYSLRHWSVRRVDYAAWRKDAAALDGYLATLAAPWPADMSPAARKAALLNAYNALLVRWVLRHYPIRSVWQTRQPFRGARHRLDGKPVSLDAIEERLRGLGDPRFRAALTWAALASPPLGQEAFVAARVEQQLDASARVFIHAHDCNLWEPHRRRVYLSMMFDWYRSDFDRWPGGWRAFIAHHSPAAWSGARTIRYLPFNWGLNDSAGVGADYTPAGGLLSRWRFGWDYLRNR